MLDLRKSSASLASGVVNLPAIVSGKVVQRPTPAVGTPVVPVEDEVGHKRHLARKLTCSVLCIVTLGILLIFLIQIVATLTSVPEWEEDVRTAMVQIEEENLVRLASDKSEFVGEVFGRLEEGVLHLQAFAGEVLLQNPPSMVVEQHLKPFWGMTQDNKTWDTSVWYIPGIMTIDDVESMENSLRVLRNRSGLMDVPFRTMQRRYDLVYMAALETSIAHDTDSGVNMQQYPGSNLTESYLTAGVGMDCDEEYAATWYDPRCRPWYQAALESTTGEMVISHYVDVDTRSLIATPAATVYSGGTLLGVVAIDVFLDDITNSIEGLRVVGDDGYAYLLEKEGGEVVAHRDLDPQGDDQTIFYLEDDLPEDFDMIVGNMSEACSGNLTYSRGGDRKWLLAWDHERVSGLSSSESDDDDSDSTQDDGCLNGFIVVVTVSEEDLLHVFSEVEDTIRNIVVLACIVMALIVLAILCLTGGFTYTVSAGVTKPVNQLVDVVRGLNRMDFYNQEAGSWMVNEVSSPEVDQLVSAFKGMTTILRSANLTLGSGDIDVAQQIYEEALILFKKLENDRGVNIVNNNLGTVYTLQARALAVEAEQAPSDKAAGALVVQSDEKFGDAVTCYRLAIEDAEMLCAGATQGEQSRKTSVSSGRYVANSGTKLSTTETESSVYVNNVDGIDDGATLEALNLQLMNRKFNLALCLEARSSTGKSSYDEGEGDAEPASITEARELMWECDRLAAERQDAVGDERRVEYLIAISALERKLPGRHKEASAAMQAAEGVVQTYRGALGGVNQGKKPFTAGGVVPVPPPPPAVLKQRLLVAQGEHSFALGRNQEAVRYWDEAVVGCGDRMDIVAVRKALMGLRGQADAGRGAFFSHDLLRALGLRGWNATQATPFTREQYAAAVDHSLARLEAEAPSTADLLSGAGAHSGGPKTKVDLCFIMDCTGSMQRWIDQSKKRLLDIIDQAKKDVSNLQLRVAYVGYRDIGDKQRFEGPYNFHTEEELPQLLDKLKNITATGGSDIPEDIAGGLNHVTQLSWESPIRLCILIADAPCHGSRYHGARDHYPKGCPNGLDPTRLLYTIQYELGVDFYFIRITTITDKMLNVFRKRLAELHEARGGGTGKGGQPRRSFLRGTQNHDPKFIVHDLGDNDNRFLEAVVESVRVSAGINLRVESY